MSTALTSPLIGAMLWEGEDGLRHAQPAGLVKVKLTVWEARRPKSQGVCRSGSCNGVRGGKWRRGTSRSLVVRFVPLAGRCGYGYRLQTSHALFLRYLLRVRLREKIE